jgi:hypothetical protein
VTSGVLARDLSHPAVHDVASTDEYSGQALYANITESFDEECCSQTDHENIRKAIHIAWKLAYLNAYVTSLITFRMTM